MKIKRPSLRGMKNCEYLGHFAQDKYIQKGHNFSGRPDLKKSKRRSPDELIISEDSEVSSDSDGQSELDSFYKEEMRAAGWPPKDSRSVLREEEIESPEERRTKGKMTTRDYMNNHWEEKEQNSDRMDSYGSDSGKSKSKYDWETTVKNGKRQHRLIRR